MLSRVMKTLIRWLAMEKGLYPSIYRRICKPMSLEYADYLRRHGGFYYIGRDTAINPGAIVTDPAYVSIGNNCSLSHCTLIGHDGSIRVLNNAYKKKLDSVGKIEIRDNSFVGHGAIILPGVTIGPNSIVAAGAVVTKDVHSGDVVAGNPARKISDIEILLHKLESKTSLYPWNDLIQTREGAFDANMEAELVRRRSDYFYGLKAGNE